MTTVGVPVPHVNCDPVPGLPPHTLDEDCWCRPTVVQCKHAGVVVNHTGLPRPATRASLSFEKRFTGELMPAAVTIRGRVGLHAHGDEL